MTTPILDQAVWTAAIQHGFSPGKHQASSPDRCVMEALAAATGAKHTDYPPCVARPLALLLQSANDGKLVTAQDLGAMAEAVVGTAGLTTRRIAFAWVDYAARVLAPVYLDSVDKPIQAATLRGMSPVSNAETAMLAERTVSKRIAALDPVGLACNFIAAGSYVDACYWAESAVIEVARSLKDPEVTRDTKARHAKVSAAYTEHVWGLIRAALATRTPTTPEAP